MWGLRTLLIVVEVLEELEEFVPIPTQNILNLRRLLWVSHKHLSHDEV